MIGAYIFTSILGIFMLSLIEFAIILDIRHYSVDLSFLNPVENYRRWTNLNWFGVLLLTFLLNVICPGLAMCYWFWKLCTVGRKR